VAQNATPIIASNVIYSNTASFHEDGGGLGGGIYLSSGSAVITGNKIISNVADVEGGGIFVGWNVPASIFSNTIAYNQVISTTGGRGGGVRTVGDTTVVIINHNDVYSNTVCCGGSGIDDGSPAILDSNYVHHNQLTDWGGSIFVGDTSSPITLTNNVIVENYETGVVGMNFGDLRIINNTVAYNKESANSAGHAFDLGAWPTTPTIPFTATLLNNVVVNNAVCGMYGYNGVTLFIDYNDTFNNSGDDYCSLASPPSGAHNISADPQFVNAPTGNYHLRFGSPAMNTGTSTNAPSYDKDGVKRPQMGRVDMGAYEVVAPYSVYLPVVLK
jgi:hypothetical protein